MDIPKTGSIKGRVLDAATGEPLRDLTVGLANASNGAPVQTDPAGRFRWTGLNRHAYVVNLWPGSGYVARRVVADLSRADTVDGIEIRAHSAAVLTGSVENAHQRPVPGLRVSATAAGMVRGLYPASVRGSATTDDLGGFRIGDLPPGRYFLRVDLPARSVEAVRAVQDPDELAVSEATTGDVATYYPNSAPMEGAATITVSAGQVVEGIRVSLAQERTMCVLWRLPQAEGPHAPVVKARVESAQRQGHNALAAGSIGGGKGGTAEVCGLPSGDYRLVLEAAQTADGGRYASVPFSVGPRSIRLPDVSLHPLTTVAGRLRIEGEREQPRLERPAFFVLRPAGRALVRGERTSAGVREEGRFTIAAVVPDDYWLSWFVPPGYYVKEATVGGADVTRTPLRAGGPAGAEFEVLLGRDPATLSVEALDGDRPAAGAVVVVWRDPPAFPAGPGDVTMAEADDGGRAAVAGLPPGKYRVFAHLDLWNDEEAQTREFLAAHRAAGESVELRPGETRTVRVPVAGSGK